MRAWVIRKGGSLYLRDAESGYDDWGNLREAQFFSGRAEAEKNIEPDNAERVIEVEIKEVKQSRVKK